MADINGYDPLKGKKRHLSSFLVEEMMYDYVAGKLDNSRQNAVSEYLKSSKEARELEGQLKNAIDYCDNLSKTQVSEPLMEKLVRSKSIWSRCLEVVAWDKWPEATRWTLEAFAISLVVAFIVAVSWPKISTWFPERQRDVVLAELDKKKADDAEHPDLASESDGNDATTEILTAAEDSKIKLPLTSKTDESQASEKLEAEKTVETEDLDTGSEKKLAKEDSIKAEPEGQQGPKETGTNTVAAAKSAVEKPMPKGFVYRAFMTLGKIESVTESIRDELQKLGGQKAGEVRMGWRKPKGSYFHFSVPESNYDAVVEMLRSFGPVQIAKDPHWRVMPEGKIRIILWVEDLDLKN